MKIIRRRYSIIVLWFVVSGRIIIDHLNPRDMKVSTLDKSLIWRPECQTALPRLSVIRLKRK